MKSGAQTFLVIPTREGWLFLAVVLDVSSRRVVGWAIGLELTATLARAALQMALRHRQPLAGLPPAQRSLQPLRQRRLPRPAGSARPGGQPEPHRQLPYDNAAMESFYSTLKIECLHRHEFATRAEAQAVAFDFIEAFYNRERLQRGPKRGRHYC